MISPSYYKMRQLWRFDYQLWHLSQLPAVTVGGHGSCPFLTANCDTVSQLAVVTVGSLGNCELSDSNVSQLADNMSLLVDNMSLLTDEVCVNF